MYLVTFAIAESISRKSCVDLRMVIVRPVRDAISEKASVCMRLNLSANLLIHDSCAAPSALTDSSCVFSSLAFFVICRNSSVPLSMSFSSLLTMRSEYSMSLIDALSSDFIVRLTSSVFVATFRIAKPALSSSLLYWSTIVLTSFCLSPISASLAFILSRLAFCSS